MKNFTLVSLISLCCLLSVFPIIAQNTRTTLYTSGNSIYTPCGEKVVLRGINKMIVWTYDLTVRHDSYSEIRKTGANCMRIVWLAEPGPNDNDAGPSGLDKNIQDCIDNKMIPMVELHDATGDWNSLQKCVNYWKSPDVLQVIKKHENYILINIANECGNETVTDDQFKTGYSDAVLQLRQAGIKAPFVIDASNWGKNLEQLRNTGNYLIKQDPEHNLIFSVHTYWPISAGADAAYITQQINETISTGIPFIIGEYTDLFSLEKICDFEFDYKTLLKLCSENQIGWLAWEWGPGNDYYDKSCGIMNMTEDSYFNTLKDTWAKEVALTSQYGIAQTSVTTQYIENGGKCDVSSAPVASDNNQQEQISPNPATDYIEISTSDVILSEAMEPCFKIFNTLGECIFKIEQMSSSVQRIDVSALSPGVYIVRFGDIVRKFVKI